MDYPSIRLARINGDRPRRLRTNRPKADAFAQIHDTTRVAIGWFDTANVIKTMDLDAFKKSM